MFNSLTGILTGKFPKQIFLDTHGIEWDICIPDSNIEMLSIVGSEVKIYVWLQHNEQLMCIYGFASVQERALFLDLLKVDGVGPKGAVKIMSSVSSGRLLDILDKGDLEMLEKIPGVGKKTASKMILALKGKLKLSEQNSTIIKLSKNSLFVDVINSLVAMGYDKKSVEQKIAQLIEVLSQEKEFSSKSQKEQEDMIFRRAIVELT